MGDPDKKRSTTGYTILMHGVPIATKSKLQTLPAKSTTGAELIALTECVSKVLWIRKILLDFNITTEIKIHDDSQTTIKTIKNQKLLKGSEHIAGKYHFVKGYVERGDIKIVHIPGDDNLADLYTKPLDKHKFEKFTNMFLYDN